MISASLTTAENSDRSHQCTACETGESRPGDEERKQNKNKQTNDGMNKRKTTARLKEERELEQ